MRIVLLQGGVSSEREISLVSSAAIAKALLELDHQLISIDPVNFGAIEDLIVAIKKEKPDLVFIGLHGTNGEDGILQAVLQAGNIKFTGSGYVASTIAFNKYLSSYIAKANNIPVPKQQIKHAEDSWQSVENDDNIYPLFVKPNTGGSSMGISLVTCKSELSPAIELAKKYDNNVLIQECIKGQEVTVSILANEVLPVVEIKPKDGFYDYKNKYSKGNTEYICPARLTDQQTKTVQDYAHKIYLSAGCTMYARVDFIFDGDDFYFLEINTLPGMTELSLLPMAAKQQGLSFVEVINKIIQLAITSHADSCIK
ncbi:MAG: D-alanine--D-alanine ligase [Candidatus Cloacimonetes bacterium]|nr:D-alanine--D-alanine ligase [Candidatus Cloacimonadota bacterium]